MDLIKAKEVTNLLKKVEKIQQNYDSSKILYEKFYLDKKFNNYDNDISISGHVGNSYIRILMTKEIFETISPLIFKYWEKALEDVNAELKQF